MKSGNNDKRVDEILHDALGSTDAKLDFGAWKAKHADEIGTFRSQASTAGEQSGTANVFRAVLAGRITKVAVAACLMIAAGLVLHVMNAPPPQEPYAHVPSPAAMMSRLQLTLAYAEGGIEAVEAQYEKAYAKLGPRADAVSVSDLFNEL